MQALRRSPGPLTQNLPFNETSWGLLSTLKCGKQASTLHSFDCFREEHVGEIPPRELFDISSGLRKILQGFSSCNKTLTPTRNQL